MSRSQLVGVIVLAIGVALVTGFFLWSRQPYSPTSSYAEWIDHPEAGDRTMMVSMDNCGGPYSSWLVYLPDRIEVSIVELGTSRGGEFWRAVQGEASLACMDIVELPLPGPIEDRTVVNIVTGHAIPSP